jgi:hypothetical protein
MSYRLLWCWAYVRLCAVIVRDPVTVWHVPCWALPLIHVLRSATA